MWEFQVPVARQTEFYNTRIPKGILGDEKHCRIRSPQLGFDF
jgi:hypothetical protein